MKEKILKITKTKYFIYISLSVIIFLQLANITNIIVNKKNAFHSDEIFSYGLANSFYEPYLDTDSIRDRIGDGHQENIGHWISGDVIRKYVTVQKGEQFRYDSVWYNQSKDRHPPLYYSVIHTISSFFPDTFSYIFGFAVNFVCFAVTQIFLYKLSRNILKSKYLAMTVCIFWGFSTAAIDLTIFIRMYCMLAMWTVIFLYLHSKLLVSDNPFFRQLVVIFIVTVCGALTQYLFLFMAFVTAVCFCTRYIFKKDLKSFFAYGFSVSGGVISAMLIYPSYLPNMLSETHHDKTKFWEQMNLCLRYLTDPLLPISKSDLIFWIPTFSSIIIALILFSIPVLYLFRDRKFVIKLLAELKNIPSGLKTFKAKDALINIVGRVKNINFMSWVMLAIISVIIAVTSYSIKFSSMFYINRYLFIIYPVTALFISCLIYFLFSWSRYKKHIASFILMLAVIARFNSWGLQYTFSDDTNVNDIIALTNDAECIFTSAEYTEMWMINYLPAVMYDSDNIFVTYIGGQQECKEQLERIDTDNPIYLFIEIPDIIEIDGNKLYAVDRYDKEKDILETYTVSENEYKTKYVDFYKELSITRDFEYIGKYFIFTREYKVYKLA